MKVKIKEVTDKTQLKDFVKFPFTLYKNHPCWVPPLIKNELSTLSRDSNPAFEHSAVRLFTAWKDGEIVGRIAGIINKLEEKQIGEKHARFGWIDFIDDPNVSSALLGAVENWGRSQGAVVLKGPYGFNQLDKNGMLVEGFDTLGTMATIYNYAYYPQHLQRLGFTKDLEWVEVDLKFEEHVVPDRLVKFMEMAQKRYGLKFLQPKNKEEMMKAGQHLFDLMMKTYEELPGFIPITDKQRDLYLKRYISFLRRDFIVIVLDSEDNPIGFGVSMPSLSKAMQKAKGKLFPFGIFHLLKARSKNDTADLALIGVEEEWRKRGVHGIIFHQTGLAFKKSGIRRVQINPMLEFNVHVLQLWKDYEHEIYKRRRTFRKEL